MARSEPRQAPRTQSRPDAPTASRSEGSECSMTARKSTKPTKATKGKGQSPHGATPDQPEANGSALHGGNVLLPAVVEAQPTPKPPIEKDELGRFLPGNNGGPGRPPGSKKQTGRGLHRRLPRRLAGEWRGCPQEDGQGRSGCLRPGRG